MGEVFVVTNTTLAAIELKDFGIVIAAGATVDLGSFDQAVLSPRLSTLLADGDLVRYVNGEPVDPVHAFAVAYPVQQAEIVSVAKWGGDYTSIWDANDAIVDADYTKPYEIHVAPGVYVEPKITLKAHVRIRGGVVGDSVIVLPSDPDDDLMILGSNTSVEGVMFSGVTGVGKSAIRISSGFTAFSRIGISNCTYGVTVAAGAGAVGSESLVFIGGPSQQIERLFNVEPGGLLSIGSCSVGVPAAILPYYVVDPVKHVVYNDGGVCSIGNSVFQIAPKTLNQCTVLTDNGGRTNLVGSSIRFSNIGLGIGSVGSDTIVSVLGSSIDQCTKHFKSDSATGQFHLLGVQTDDYVADLVAGTFFGGVIGEYGQKEVDLMSSTTVEYSGVGRVPLGRLLRDFVSSGVGVDSGVNPVTDGGGLDIDVAAGSGYVQDSGNSAMSAVSWDATTLTLANNATEYIYYRGSDGVVAHNASAPNELDDLLLAKVVTKGGSVRWIHDLTRTMTYPSYNLYNYTKSIHRILANTGLVISEGTAKKLTIGQGSYWAGTILHSRAAASDVVFDYYWNGGADETLAQDTIDDVRYDNAGTLTAMTDNTYYKADTVYMTSDGKLSVLYGTSEYETEVEALAAARTPSFVGIDDTAIPLAKIITKKNNGIVNSQDLRPFIQYGTAAQAGGAPTSHSSLSDLDHDDHTQYLLVSGGRSMGGDLDMAGSDVTNAGTYNTVDVAAHGARHMPGALDELTVGIPVAVGAANDEGGAASFSRSDHVHDGDARYVQKNTAIMGTTKTKITYDAKGLVTAGGNATKADVGLTNVTDDAQLKRADGDFATFAAKSALVAGDILLVEDSESVAPVNAKKRTTVGGIPHQGLSGAGTNTHSQVDGHISAASPHAGHAVGPGASVDGEIALYSGAGGETLTRASGTGMLKASSGVLATASAGSDYQAPVTRTNSVLAAPVAMVNGNQFYTGPLLANLPAGTYFVTGSVLVRSPNNIAMRVTAKLWDGVATVWVGAEDGRVNAGPGVAGYVNLTFSAVVTLGAATNVQIDVASTAAGCSIRSTPDDNAAGIGNTSSYLHALKLA